MSASASASTDASDEKVYTLVFDTESTGLPTEKPFRLVELGYALYDDDGNEVGRYCSMVKPEGFEIKNHHIHGITTEKALRYGEDVRVVLERFGRDLKRTKRIIAHNFGFDEKMIIHECNIVRGMEWVAVELTETEFYCTCYNGAFRYLGPGYDRIKLVDLYEKVTGERVKQDHRAMADVEMCATCYFSLVGKRK